MHTSPPPEAGSWPLALSRGVLAAVAWCRFGAHETPLPHPEPADFLAAESLGLVRSAPTWDVTPHGIGVLIAAGLLPATAPREPALTYSLWSVYETQRPRFIAALTDRWIGTDDCLRRLNLERHSVSERLPVDDVARMRFLITQLAIDFPACANPNEDTAS
jgi:hypothetical protein